jgi:hypothetical protein
MPKIRAEMKAHKRKRKNGKEQKVFAGSFVKDVVVKKQSFCNSGGWRAKYIL